MIAAIEPDHAAGAAFDAMADDYDQCFTWSMIGSAQRAAVWQRAAATFRSGDHILELNCGTGEDALFLAGRGMRVTACDASGLMIERAKARQKLEAPDESIEFQVLPTEELRSLPEHFVFDGVFSNFSGLNCVADLNTVSSELAKRLRPGAQMLLCLSTRFCLWEILHYAINGNVSKAARRWRGVSDASFGSRTFTVYYPTIRSLRRIFAPEFQLLSVMGIGIAVPPSYLERWICRHPRLLTAMTYFDKAVCHLPVFRSIGDHVLLSMKKI